MDSSILIFIAGLVLAAILGGIIFRKMLQQSSASLQQQLIKAKEEGIILRVEKANFLTEEKRILASLTAAETTNGFLKEQQALLHQLQTEHSTLQNLQAHTKNTLANAEEKLANQKEEITRMAANFRQEFQLLAQNILEEKTKKFTEVNETKMNDILQPFKNQLGEFKKQVEETYDKESKERFALGKEVQSLVSMTQQVSTDAHNLTTALKGNNKMQGHWGEMLLESILENSGLAKHREYFLQEFIRDNAGNVIKDENGKGLQPDAIIVYPDGRKIIIDSKVSLVAWDSCVAATEAEEQKKCVQELVKSIRRHADGLSNKNYPHYAGALDYVLLFIPIEPAFLEALKEDKTLWKYAYDKNILLVSPNNLLAVLKIIASMWKVEQQSQNAIHIAKKAGDLYDKFAGFIENFETMGKKITDAAGSYEHAHKQLTSGRGNITGRIEELRKMGVKSTKELPERLLGDEME